MLATTKVQTPEEACFLMVSLSLTSLFYPSTTNPKAGSYLEAEESTGKQGEEPGGETAKATPRRGAFAGSGS